MWASNGNLETSHVSKILILSAISQHDARDPGEDHEASKLIFILPIFLYFSALVIEDWEIYLPAPIRTSNLVCSGR